MSGWTVQGAATEGLDFLLDRYCRLGGREMPSGAAIDLLRGLLTVDPARRLTIEQVRHHISPSLAASPHALFSLSIVEGAPSETRLSSCGRRSRGIRGCWPMPSTLTCDRRPSPHPPIPSRHSTRAARS